MFLEMGLPITYLSFLLDHDGPFVYPADFDADFWRRAEGPRRTFSHQPPPKDSRD
jgi:tRNA (guanine-N7-)-methyltransferase